MQLPRAGDTGDGWLILQDTNSLGSNKVWAPRQAVTFLSGDGNSGDTGYVPYIFAGDRLRARFINQAGKGTAITGRFYAYFRKG